MTKTFCANINGAATRKTFDTIERQLVAVNSAGAELQPSP